MSTEYLPMSVNENNGLPQFISQDRPEAQSQFTQTSLPFKFVFYSRTAPHETMIAQAFYQIAILDKGNWQQTADTVCYRYGIGGDYLDNCLAKVRVFNPSYCCIDCGTMYQVTDPTQATAPVSNVFHYVSNNSDIGAGHGYSEQNSFSHNNVQPVATGEWRCADCNIFWHNGTTFVEPPF